MDVDGLLSLHEIFNGDHPLTLGNNSIWHQCYKDAEIVELIDLERRHPYIKIFPGNTSPSKRNQVNWIQFYAFKRITLRLTREFEFHCIVGIWDCLLGNPFCVKVQEMLLRVCCAMLVFCGKHELLKGDFVSNLKHSQHYPKRLSIWNSSSTESHQTISFTALLLHVRWTIKLLKKYYVDSWTIQEVRCLLCIRTFVPMLIGLGLPAITCLRDSLNEVRIKKLRANMQIISGVWNLTVLLLPCQVYLSTIRS